MDKSRLKKLLFGEFSWQRMVQSILSIYVAVAAYLYFRGDSLIFQPQKSAYQDTKEVLKIPVSSNEKISAIYLTNPQAEYTLLYNHGNASDIGYVRPLLNQFRDWGFNVFAYDYRGYGTSDGQPSENNAYQDGAAAYKYLTQDLKIPPQKIIIYGQSLGGGMAADLASKNPAAGLVLESTFTSTARVLVPFPFLPFDKFTSLDKLRRVSCPVLVIHGDADNVIPFSHGQQLFAAAAEPKLSLWVKGAGHNDLTDVAADRHRQALISFRSLIASHNK
jgi:abhydrolase domain-containing protein 17